MKKLSKLIPSFAMLLLSVVLLSTSTLAWFSMNTRVTVTGMAVTTKVSNNLLIAPVDTSDITKEGNTDSAYLNALHQVISAQIQPTSTVDGVSYWYTSTTNVTASGDAKTDVYTEYSETTALENAAARKTNYDSAFNANHSITSASTLNVVYGYVDYAFYLKATNADSVVRSVYMSRCNLTYDGSVLPASERSWRVALLVQEAEAETKQDTALTSSDLKSIIAPASATYFTSGKAISSDAAPTVDVAQFSSAAIVDDALDAGTTKYYKVTVRLWLEGEDTTCNNDTFASLTEKYRLDLAFDVGDGLDPESVTTIGTVANAVATASTNVATLTLTDGKLTNGETVLTINWKNASDDSAASGTPSGSPTGTTFTASAEGSIYCEVVTTKGNIYVTNTVEVTAP